MRSMLGLSKLGLSETELKRWPETFEPGEILSCKNGLLLRALDPDLAPSA